MTEWGSTVLVSITSFIATNLDDLFLLMLFFGQRKRGFRAGQIVAGQFLGFAALVAVSLSGILLHGRFPERWLGLLPIFIGALRLWRMRKPPEPDYTPKRPVSSVGAV